MFDLRKSISLICERAEIGNRFTFHSLRHTYASYAILSAKAEVVQKLLNHSQIGMTMRYTHLADESLKLATENVAVEIDKMVAESASLKTKRVSNN